jgi:hypothetical protein
MFLTEAKIAVLRIFPVHACLSEIARLLCMSLAEAKFALPAGLPNTPVGIRATLLSVPRKQMLGTSPLHSKSLPA